LEKIIIKGRVLPDLFFMVNEKRTTLFFDEGEFIKKENHRRVLTPDMDTTDFAESIKVLTDEYWTEEVIQNYKDSLKEVVN